MPTPDRHADRLRLLADVIAHDGRAFVDRVQRALRLATDLLGYDIGLLSHIVDADYTIVAAHAPGTEIAPGTVFDLGDTYCSLTLARGDLLEIAQAAGSEYDGHPCHREFGLESYLGVPIRVDGAVWGTLNFSAPQPLAAPLEAADHDLARLFAVWIGGVLEREARDRRIADEAGRLASVVDQAPLVVYRLDADGRFTMTEGAGLRALNQTPGQIVGASVFDLLPPDDVSVAAVRRILAGEPQSWEARLGGTVFANQARPVRAADGSVGGIVGVATDVTAQADARRGLAASEARHRALSEATFEGIVYSVDGVVIDANTQAARLFGFAKGDDLVGRGAEAFVADDWQSIVAEAIATDRAEAYECVCVRADGTRFWAEVQGRRAEHEGRAVRVTAIRDVTARKEADEKRRFQADVLAHVSDAVVALDLEGRITYWNRGAEELHGHRGDEVLGRALADVVHYALPDDDPSVHDDNVTPEAALRSEAARNGELVYVAPDGRERFVSVSTSVLSDEAGHPIGLLAVSRDVTARRRMSARLRHQATHDALTELPNRTLFRERIEQAIADGAPFAVMFVDLDRFKVVNDSLGHDAGDRLLREVAARLRATLRASDAVVARLGGDEFGVVAPTTDAPALAQTLLDALAQPLDLGPRTVSPGASVGVVADGQAYDAPGALLRDADTAMYAAKRAGRGQFALFAPAMHREAALRFGLEQDLRYAAARGQIVPYFQPVVDLATGRVAGFEALARWHHPELGQLAPDQFLPLAEELGLLADLDRWILDRTCETVATWGGEAVDALSYVSVNCSDRTFLAPDLAAHARAAADAAGLPPDRLVLELTERALIDVEAARHVVDAAHRYGLRLAIDDFGAGFSSLGLLHALPVDALKIDRSFVADLDASGSARALVRAVVGLSGDLGMTSIAEGVETPGQLRAVREAGATYGQGFLFAHALPADEARALLASPPWTEAWPDWIAGQGVESL
ncbi:EAL domain-containing protein [Rubrivirga sp. IMCC45206]|uniref:EAL domain-containing protein n=1 Tax=Rubrivirga sp. IMCC45206 TaxID=3391614 RepID=UPI00398FB006